MTSNAVTHAALALADVRGSGLAAYLSSVAVELCRAP